MNHIDSTDLMILDAVQESFPLTPNPFLDLGRSLGLGEHEVLDRIRHLMSLGLIRRIGPILDKHRMGYSGVLVALPVPDSRVDEVSGIVNRYEEISHNYLRPNETAYNMWFTVSARQERISAILREIEATSGLKPLVLPTLRIFKIGVKFDMKEIL